MLEKWVGRGMMLSAKVRTEDGNEFWCAIDTGSEITSVPGSLETRLGKRLGGGMMRTMDSPKDEPIRFYAAPTIYLGSTRLEMGKTVDTGGGSNFILGMDCLRHYCVQLDFGAGTMRFLDPKHLNTGELGKAFPLVHSRYAMIRHAGLFGEKNSNLLIDTGCALDGYLVPALFQEAVQNQHGNAIPMSVDGVIKGKALNMAEFQRCTWDGTTYSDVIVGRGPLNLIGMRFLGRHLVTFNFPKNVMYLKRTTADPLK
jgi:hypothetical protein